MRSLSLAMILLAACGQSDPMTEPTDAQTTVDAQTSVDAQTPLDAGFEGADTGVEEPDSGTELDAGRPATVSYSQDIQPIWNRSCGTATCHTGSRPAAGLSLGENSYRNLVNVASVNAICRGNIRIVPFDPATSLLYRKVSRDRTVCGNPMPSRSTLPAPDQTLIRTWIEEGAQDN